MDYRASGVDIDAGNKAVELIKDKVKRTYNKNVLNSLGGFAAMYELGGGFKEPVLVSCTDGVGTKVKVAIELGILNTIGIDLVAMNVNDLICTGARPLFFLDYIACHKNVPEHMADLIEGMTQGCLQAGCALVGGEMAEMRDVYAKGDFDLAGFAVGVVDKSKIIDGKAIKPGQFIYGFASSGLHSNGYSLARWVLDEETCRKNQVDRKMLLTPTRIYVKEVLELVSRGTVTGLAHITGGGIAENLIRVLPEGARAVIKKDSIPSLPIFETIQNLGHVEEAEMLRVFNMGVGMIVISSAPLTENPGFFQIGLVEAGERGVVLT